jgi:hypothetical protein
VNSGSGSGPRSARAGLARCRGALAVALVVAGTLVADALPARGASGWSVVPTAKLSQTNQSYFDAVSCAPGPRKPMTCFAVGSRVTIGGVTRPLIERWTGNGWKAVSAPFTARAIASSLAGVSCPTATSCIAVGNVRGSEKSPSAPLIAHWRGGGWKFVTGPRPKGATGTYLHAVSCTGPASCVAVGSYSSKQTLGAPLALRWNGRTWSLAALPRPGNAAATTLSGVSCTGARAASVCWAVGSYATRPEGEPFFTVAARLAHGRWKLFPSPNYNKTHYSAFTSVSCSGPKRCLAAGYWRHGSGATFGARWNGKRWTAVRTRNPRGFTFSHLAGISCASATRCVAVGTYAMGGTKSLTLVEQWNGRVWQVQPSPQPRKSASSALLGVSCTSATRCVGVGTYRTNKFGNPAAGFGQHRS